MKNVLAAVFLALQEAQAQQPAGAKSWGPGVQVLEEADKASGELNLWVRAGQDSVLSPEYLAVLKKHHLVADKGLVVKKKLGRTAVDAVLVFKDKLYAKVRQAELEVVSTQSLKLQVKELQNELKIARDHSASDHAMAALMDSIRKAYQAKGPVKPVKFTRAKPSKSGNMVGIPTLTLSDWHWGETVDGEQMFQKNEYNLDIAEKRANVLFEKTLQTLFQRQAGATYDGFVLQMAGDMVSGNIHDDLRVTNGAPILDCVMSMAERIARGVLEIAENFEWVYVPCVVGNHGRIGKPGYKNVAIDNYDFLLYKMVEKLVQCQQPAGKNNVEFDISNSTEYLYNVYGTGYLLTHGDSFSESVSEDNFWSALNKAANKKKQLYTNAGGKGFNHMVCGHFHRYGAAGSVIVNGSLKGYDEYARHHNYSYEEPSQALWITHPEEGITSHHAIYVDGPDPAKCCDAPPITRGDVLMGRR